VFEFLFKYRPIVFEKGRLVIAADVWMIAAVALLTLLGLMAVVGYRRLGLDRGRRTALALLRAGAILLVAGCLLRPALLVTTAIPQRNVLGILLDDSESMQIADDGTVPRSAILLRLLGDPESDLVRALGRQFQLRFYRFAGSAERIGAGDSLRFEGRRSSLASALDDVRRDLAALPLAGLVMATDGADNADTALTAALLSMAATGVPVHTVGIGQERYLRDLEVSRVDAPRTAVQGSSVLVETLIRHQGTRQDSAEVVVEDEGRILASRRFALPPDGGAATVRIPLALPASGPRGLTVRVPAVPGEVVTRNNERRALVSVIDRTERVLYFEGEPRFEFAFLRRAVAADRNLQVVGLQRTAENKFLRLGVTDSLDLMGGFPRTREELFRYRGLVLGSVEAAAFTADQLRMVSDFVSRRGGGLLFLGGRRAFAEGGYRDTPLEDALPVALEVPADTGFLRELRVAVTPAGRLHPVVQLAADERASAARWDSLPPVTTVNPVGLPKAGATILLTGTDSAGREEQPVLTVHRFGRGRAAALAIQDAWLWRMHGTVPPEDDRHQRFIRQLVRWLAAEAPDRIEARVEADEVGPGEAVNVMVEVRDALWEPVNGASVTAVLMSPSGRESTRPLEWMPGADGRYRLSFPAREAGQYEITTLAAVGADTLRAEPVFVRAGETGREFFGAELRSAVLRRIANETGGRFYTPETVSTLPSDVVYTEKGITATERLDLWDMPVVLLVLLGLLATEWSLRRRWGLA
jgi:uncharacterized membrane protein